MNKLSKQHLINFLQTEAGKNALREASRVVSEEVISAAKYYIGTPDGKYFEASHFEENVVRSKKAYVTFNTIMGGDTAEQDRFNEGKKQIPELLTPFGVKKMVSLFTHLFYFASKGIGNIGYETVRACRQSEVSEGESIVGPLTSTTKLSVDEIMKLGYGNKNGLAICRYKFHNGVVIFDMETLKGEYLKPEEREVLLLTGNKLVAHCYGYDKHYIGKDGQPALMYNVEVFPPEFKNSTENQGKLEKIVYDASYIAEIRKFYEALNKDTHFPNVPKCYEVWKRSFKELTILELSKLV